MGRGLGVRGLVINKNLSTSFSLRKWIYLLLAWIIWWEGGVGDGWVSGWVGGVGHEQKPLHTIQLYYA